MHNNKMPMKMIAAKVMTADMTKMHNSPVAMQPVKSYSAKSARAGKDIGKKGKNFAKIASSAAKRYGSAEAGKRVAGAILRKLRNK